MRVLLVNPPNNHSISTHVPEYVASDTGYLPPLGLLGIATNLVRTTNHTVHIYDALVNNGNYNDIGHMAQGFDLVGITSITFFLMDVFKTVQAVKKACPSIPVVLGGPHVAIYPEESLAIPGVDYCLKGEAERSFAKLVEALSTGQKDFSKIPDLYWRQDGQTCHNPTQGFIEDLDSLPIPDRTLLDYRQYQSILSQQKTTRHYATTAFSSRGCPYRCIFCDRPHFGKRFRAHSADWMVREIEQCLELGITGVFYYDDTFTIDRDRVMEFCSIILDKGLEFTWDIRARVNTVDVQMLQIMRRAGCTRIHFGVEAGTPEMLKALRKGITLRQAEEAFAQARKAGIEVLGYFMIGCPNETIHQMQQTLNFALKLKPDYMHLAILTPFPGTPLYQEALQAGLYETDYWRDYALNPRAEFLPRYLPNTEPPEVMLQLIKKAYRRFYLRPSYLLAQSMKVRSIANFLMKTRVAMKILFG